MSLPFERSEYLDRVRKTKERMAAEDLDAILVANPANMCYLTGYDATSFYVHQAVILSLAEEEPIWAGRAMDVPCAWFTTYLDRARIIGYPESYVGSSERHVAAFFADVLREHGLARGRIGLELDAISFTAREYLELQRALPEAELVDADVLVNWVRIIKSPQEVEYMRQAAAIADRAMQTAFEVIEPGVRQCDAAAEIEAALIHGTPEFGGADPNTLTIMAGERSAAPHLSWTDDPFAGNEVICVELGGCRHRYHSALARTFHLGPPPEKLTRLVPVVVDGMAAAIDAARAGSTCEDVEAAWRRVINAAGFEKESRIGYSIGIGFKGQSWVERTASLKAGDRTVLEPNMTFHMILGMWMGEWGFELSDVLRVTEIGPPETFARMPRELLVKQ